MSFLPFSDPEDDPTDSTQSPGHRLRVARQKHGLDVARVAGELRLSRTVIEALERDEYEAIPGNVFVTGYIRNYARLMGLDAEDLLDAYRASNPHADTPSRPRIQRQPAHKVNGERTLVRLGSIALVILIAGLALFWWQNEYQGGDVDMAPEGAAPATEAAAPLASTTAPGPAAPAAPTTREMAPSPAPRGAQSAPMVTASAQSPSAPAAISEQPRTVTETPSTPTTVEPTAQEVAAAGDEDADTAAGENEVVVAFSGPCWVDIRDVERKFKLFGEMSKGDRHVLEGTPPYSIILGNSAAVQITVNGTPFDLEAISRGNVARFALDPSQLP